MSDVTRTVHGRLLDGVGAILEHRAAFATDQPKLQAERIVFLGHDCVNAFLLKEIRPFVDSLAVETIDIVGEPGVDPRPQHDHRVVAPIHRRLRLRRTGRAHSSITCA